MMMKLTIKNKYVDLGVVEIGLVNASWRMIMARVNDRVIKVLPQMTTLLIRDY